MTQVNLQLPDGSVRPAPSDEAIFAVTTTTGTQTFTLANEKSIRYVLGVRIVNASGISRSASGAVVPLPSTVATNTGNTVTVTDGSFAAGDTVFIRYTYYSL